MIFLNFSLSGKWLVPCPEDKLIVPDLTTLDYEYCWWFLITITWPQLNTACIAIHAHILWIYCKDVCLVTAWTNFRSWFGNLRLLMKLLIHSDLDLNGISFHLADGTCAEQTYKAECGKVGRICADGGNGQHRWVSFWMKGLRLDVLTRHDDVITWKHLPYPS